MSNTIAGDAGGVSSKFDAFGQELFVGDWIAHFRGGRGSFYMSWYLITEINEGSFKVKEGRHERPPQKPGGGEDWSAPRSNWVWVDSIRTFRAFDNAVKAHKEYLPSGLIDKLTKKFYGPGDGETPPEAAS